MHFSDLASKQPLGQLSPQPWLQQEATQKLIAALCADGDQIRFVGGCVRDSIAHKPVQDIDLAVPFVPERTMELLERAGLRMIPTGLKHGTVTALVDGVSFEITTLRRDVATDGRHAEVEFTDDWRADAARRDFTINAMSCTPDGAVYDYFDGLADLGNGVVRFVGVPKKRLEEDILRLLRFFRFFAFYGIPPIDADSLAACRVAAPELENLSAERVSSELLRMLASPDPAGVYLLMNGERVLSHILPEASNFGRLRLMAWLETRGLVMESLKVDPIRRLAALVRVSAAEAEEMARRLRLSKAQIKRLVRLSEPAVVPHFTMSKQEAYQWLNRLGAEEFRDLVLLSWCEHKAVQARPQPGETDRWINLLCMAEVWHPVVFPLVGEDVLKQGIPSGKQVGHLLDDVRSWWEKNDFQADRADCLAELHRRIMVLNVDEKG